MTCIYCQKQFARHTQDELVSCSNWIQNTQHDISQNYRTLVLLWTELKNTKKKEQNRK